MGNIFEKDWTGPVFVTFGPTHLFSLIVVGLCIVAMIVYGKRATEGVRRRMRIILACVLCITESSYHLWHIMNGTWTPQIMLPLHLCAVMLWLNIVMLLTGNHVIFEISYLLGIAGALQALLTPDVGIYGFPHYRAFQSTIAHGTLIAASLYMALVEGYRPTQGSIIRVLLLSNLFGALVFVVNKLIGSNYLFIAHKPETPSLLDLMPPWPWYLLIIEALAIFFILSFYFPYWIKDRFRIKYLQFGSGA